MSFNANAQRGVRIGYIDTEYILQNVPEYKEASTQLDKKVLQWKTEIEKRLNAIEQKKNELDNESVLLTKELYDERFEDISFEEAEILDYQQKRFGPSGDLMIQKRQLIEPIQDQIFAAVQEIATTKKYDFVLDKSADVVMLYSAERYDISEQVLRTITRTSKRSQAKNKKERKELENESVVPVVSEEKDARQQALEDRKATREAELALKRADREKAAEDRRNQQQELREAKKREADERRQNALDAKNKTSNTKEEPDTEEEPGTEEEPSTEKAPDAEGIIVATAATTAISAKTSSSKPVSSEAKGGVKKDSTSSKKALTVAEIKAKDRENRRKELEAKKQKILDQRKKAREDRLKQVKKNDSIAKAKKQEVNN